MGRAISYAAFFGALYTVIGIFPVAAVSALLWKIPVPFRGYPGGWDAMLLSPLAVLFYGILTWGFLILAVLGAVGGAIVQAASRKREVAHRLLLAVSLVIAFLSVVFINNLHRLIGPW